MLRLSAGPTKEGQGRSADGLKNITGGLECDFMLVINHPLDILMGHISFYFSQNN